MFKKNPTSVRLTLRALGYLLSYPDAQLRNVMPQLIDALQPYVRDLVIAAPDRPYLGALVWLDATACRDAGGAETYRPVLSKLLAAFNARPGGSSTRVMRLLPLDVPPSPEAGEVTDKRSINARRVLEQRGADVARLYAEPVDPAAYIVRRVLALIPTLFFASLIVFVTVRMIPGDVIDLMLSQNDIAASKMGREQLEKALGLDQPMWIQYGRWVGAILFHGDFGRSLWQSTPVSEQLLQRLPVTFELGLMALIVGLSVAVPIGVYSAVRQDTPGDY
eukprot:gene45235-60416_t